MISYLTVSISNFLILKDFYKIVLAFYKVFLSV